MNLATKLLRRRRRYKKLDGDDPKSAQKRKKIGSMVHCVPHGCANELSQVAIMWDYNEIM